LKRERERERERERWRLRIRQLLKIKGLIAKYIHRIQLMATAGLLKSIQAMEKVWLSLNL